MVLFVLENNIDSNTFIKRCFAKYLELVAKVNLVKNPINLPNNVGKDDLIQNLQIVRTGKPYLAYNDVRLNVCFNLSHTEGLMVLLMGETEAGVDCEKHKERNYKALAEREFSGRKVATLEEFYDMWTKREAYVKLKGGSVAEVKNIEESELKQVKTIKIIKDYSISVVPSDNLLLSILT